MNSTNMNKMPSRRGFLAILRDRSGVAAVEFAFIAPVLLALYFVTMEVSQGIEANKKVSRVASMVADLITQQQTMSRTEIEGIMKVGESVLQPYNRSKPTIVATAIEVTDEPTPKVRVVWSRKLQGDSFSVDQSPGTTTTVPEQLKIRGSFLIRVQTRLEYKPVITWTAEQKTSLGLAAAFDKINMRETYFLRPRMTNRIECPTC